VPKPFPKEVLDGIGCPECDGEGISFRTERGPRAAGSYSWVTSQVFRKTVATRLDAFAPPAGLEPATCRVDLEQVGQCWPMTKTVVPQGIQRLPTLTGVGCRRPFR
jgi:hypothetical protein